MASTGKIVGIGAAAIFSLGATFAAIYIFAIKGNDNKTPFQRWKDKRSGGTTLPGHTDGDGSGTVTPGTGTGTSEFAKMCPNGWTNDSFPIKYCSKGDKVSQVQKALGIGVDGKFGNDTHNALNAKFGITEIPDQATLNKVLGIEEKKPAWDQWINKSAFSKKSGANVYDHARSSGLTVIGKTKKDEYLGKIFWVDDDGFIGVEMPTGINYYGKVIKNVGIFYSDISV